MYSDKEDTVRDSIVVKEKLIVNDLTEPTSAPSDFNTEK